MTPEELAADRAICDAATRGPWDYVEDRVDRPMPADIDADVAVISPNGEEVAAGDGMSCDDLTFIAAARTRWPAALDEIERLKKEAAFLRDQFVQQAKVIQRLELLCCEQANRIAAQSDRNGVP